ncbi:ComF family protein [bacterium]|nr:ComF family protein [bacterium]MCG2676562.1 ComF family protein [bacterium]
MSLYQGVMREAILLLKYQKVKALISPLGKLLLKYCQENLKINDFDLVLPVPLYRSKRKEREFNQAEVFARIIDRHYSLPLSHENLLRIRDTRTMSGLNPEERRRNVKGAFSVKRQEEVKNKRILLIDDICTTGATVDECSKVLLTAGVKEVTVLTLARTPSKI